MTTTHPTPHPVGVRVVELAPFGVLLRPGSLGHDLRELPVDTLRRLVRRHRLLVLRGFAGCVGDGELAEWASAWGRACEVLDTDEKGRVPLHWDGLFAPRVPEFQILDCVSASEGGQAGRTLYCDTVRLLADADAMVGAGSWQGVTVTYRVPGGQRAACPLVVPHPRDGAPTLRFHEPPHEDDPDLLDRPSHQFDGIDAPAVPALLDGLRAALHDPRYLYAHAWRTGDVVVADNHALLHGREAPADGTHRRLRQVRVLGEPLVTTQGAHHHER
ncbi:TauD/TfdA dioxygenase family protein [Streptomyces abikoensis]|uniref:TauD/TfdA dioxygenase family protein n=1 Tax=Streptomyces abikoensis TaxID=97398 RepID=UPI00371177A6